MDLRGWWNLPSNKSGYKSLRVLGQCKAEKTKVGPRLIREMEGVARRTSWQQELESEESDLDDREAHGDDDTYIPRPREPLPPMVTLICSASGFSAQAMLDARSSSVPMLLLHAPFEAPMYHYTGRRHSKSSPALLPGSFDGEHPSKVVDGLLEAIDDAPELVETSIESLHVLAGSFWNAALLGPRGVLDTTYEIRKETFGPDEGPALESRVTKSRATSRGKRPAQVLHRVGIWRDGRPIDVIE